MPPTINKKKAERLIVKGDKLIKKGKFKRGLGKFRKALKYDPERIDIYDRLVRAHEKATKEWKELDMAESVGWVMKKQEIENPLMRLTHKKLTPEGEAISEKIRLLIGAQTETEECRFIDEICSFGTEALYPLIDTILQIKSGFKNKEKPKDQNNV